MALPEPEGLSPTQLRSHRLALKLLLPLLVVLVLIVVPLYLLFDVSQVRGDSMVPTLADKEYLIITRGLNQPRRGDVVVLHWAHDGVTEEIVKRVVALPGDAVSVRGDFVTVNGRPEAFAHRIMAGGERVSLDVTVPPGRVFFLGDNRPVSLDSRFIGTLPLSSIHGRAVAVWAPVTRIRVVPSP